MVLGDIVTCTQVTSDKVAHYHKDSILFWQILNGPPLDLCVWSPIRQPNLLCQIQLQIMIGRSMEESVQNLQEDSRVYEVSQVI